MSLDNMEPDWDHYDARKSVPSFSCWRIHPNAQLPTRAHDTDVGWDVYTVQPVSFAATEYFVVRTGLVIQPPVDYYFELVPRSSTFRKFGLVLTNSIGVIDPTFCGPEDEVVGLWYATRKVEVPVGTRLMQLILRRLIRTNMVDATGLDFPVGNRGGVGSTGV